MLPPGFQNVSSVVFWGVDLGSSPGFFAIDNLVVVPIPEPTSLALLGLGLAGLAMGGSRGGL